MAAVGGMLRAKFTGVDFQVAAQHGRQAGVDFLRRDRLAIVAAFVAQVIASRLQSSAAGRPCRSRSPGLHVGANLGLKKGEL